MKEKRVRIGMVGVDSGQLMLCDPCYIDSEWRKTKFDANRRYVNEAGQEVVWPRDFKRYDEPLKCYGDGTTPMNDLLKFGVFKAIPNPIPKVGYEFSYDGACKATTSEQHGGNLIYRLGHAGAGVAVSAGWGDGCYNVYATIRDGRVMKVEVDFRDEGDEDEVDE